MQLFQVLDFLPLSFQLTALMYAGVCLLCGKEFFHLVKPDLPGPAEPGDAGHAEGFCAGWPNPRVGPPHAG